MELKVGDKIKDNDPRVDDRILTVVEISPCGKMAYAVDTLNRRRRYDRFRIFTDGKARRYGFSLVVE